MTYEEFDKRCDELENAPLQERKTFFADVLAGETEKTDVRMMAFFRYALLFYRAGDFLAAREILEPFIIDYKSYRYRPEIIACFNLVGVVAYYVQEYALSRFYIHEGLKIAREHSEVSRYAYEYNNLAVTYLAQQDYEKALEVIREAEKNMPVSDEVMHAYIYRNLAEICCHLDRLDEAKDALAKCVAYRGREVLPEEVRIVNTLLTYKSGDTAGYKRCCAELREHLPQLHAEEFLASCKVLFDCGMDAGDNAQVEWVLDAMDAYLRRDPKEAQVGLRAETCRYEYAKANGNTALMLAALEKKETYYALVLARKEEVRVRDAGRYLHIGQRLHNALESEAGANRTKTRFLANMSHDIRTPMNAIVGFTTLAASRIDQPERVQEYLGKIQSSSAHLLSLINDILDMSHIESGKVSLDEQPYNLVDLLEDLYSIIQAETSARQLYFTVDTTGVRHADVRCDKLRINQILLNLLGNALKFTNPGGFVKVKVDELDGAPAGYGRYRFIVSDTGIGMSPEFVEHIFDPFERERTSTISGIQGTGLGMTITKNLVDMMHGSIAVKSVQGKGTAFTIELTLQLAGKRAAAAHESKAPHANARHHLQKSRILLVDDNDLNREIAITLLEDEGLTVEYAVDGCEAVKKIMNSPAGHYQLVLMDVQMPVMNGYEATKAIRRLSDPTRAKVPILAMTADAFEEDRQKALRSGMDGHLSKPIEIDRLFEALDELLD